MSEEILVRHCSPTLANIKTGNLVNCRIDSVYRLKKDIISLNSVLNAKGVSIRVLYCSSERALIYVYRPEKLNADMQNGKDKKFLNSIGYRGTTNDELINELSARVYSCGGFPHEIGLFLGYPIDDVISFIENKGKNFKCCGCWKVYHDEDNAKKTFEKYKKCTNIYCKKYLQGSSLKRLTV